MSKNKVDRTFAWFSLGFALFHFVEETATYIMYGAYLPMLVVDYIGISVLSLGAILLLRKDWHMGVLCGGWGFEACLLYRSYFSRLSGAMDTMTEGADAAAEMQGLAIFMVVVFCAFFFSIWRCEPRSSKNAAT